MKLQHKKFLPLLSAFVDRELKDDVRHQVEEHLEACEECSGVLENFRRLKSAGSTAKPFPINPHYLTRIRAALGEGRAVDWDASVIEAKLLGPLLAILVVAVILLFSVVEKERVASSDDYLYFGGQRTVIEQQLLSRLGPLSKDEVLLLTISTHGGEESNGR